MLRQFKGVYQMDCINKSQNMYQTFNLNQSEDI